MVCFKSHILAYFSSLLLCLTFYGDVALFFQIFLDCSFPMNFLLKFYPSLMRWKGIRIVLIDHGKFRTVLLHFPNPPR